VTVHADKQRKDDPDVKDAFQTRADYCLMATGRKPNTKSLGLEEVGIATLVSTLKITYK
jgi:pyruvate/2-oxoglutarate dehydrogenase complex dihydrolipoamide dehydrogenase (E3) component